MTTIVPNAVSKPGPVAPGPASPKILSSVRGGGVKLDEAVLKDFWRSYRLLDVSDESALQAVQDAISMAGVGAAPGFETLELAEKFALYKYTSSEYQKWNGYLRSGKGNYKAHCEIVSSALGKLGLEATYATTYRVEKFSERRHPGLFTRGTGTTGTPTVNHVIDFAAFTSTAFAIDVVEASSQFKGAGAYIKYVISNHQGKRVNFLSLKPLECELIIDSGAQFRITGGPEQPNLFNKDKRSGPIVVEVEQI